MTGKNYLVSIQSADHGVEFFTLYSSPEKISALAERLLKGLITVNNFYELSTIRRIETLDEVTDDITTEPVKILTVGSLIKNLQQLPYDTPIYTVQDEEFANGDRAPDYFPVLGSDYENNFKVEDGILYIGNIEP